MASATVIKLDSVMKFCCDIALYILNSKYYLDLNQCIVSDLEKAGVQNIDIAQTCSYEEKKCYSYRKNDSVGRMYSFITLY